MINKLFGITGFKGSGKSTLATVLEAAYGFKIYSLAEPMKKGLKKIFDFTDEQLYGDQKEVVDKRYNTTPRKIMQIFGTEIFQFDIYKHLPEMEKVIPKRLIWCKLFHEWYKNNTYSDSILRDTGVERTGNYCIDDVRFQHEADYIRNLGGKIIHIINVNLELTDEHASETEINKILPDMVIYNIIDPEKTEKENLKVLIDAVKSLNQMFENQK